MAQSKILIVGCGLSGVTIARMLAEANYLVDVIDVRDHIAGNCYDYTNEHGIRIHKYGPHIFHTSNKDVWDFLSRFTEWVEYKHKVKALLADGRFATLPVNRETKAMVGEENVVDTFIRPYTLKMWGKPIEELDPSILQRVPIRDDDNDLYFPNDIYQAMPKDGYVAMFEKMLAHDNIRVRLSTPFSKEMEADYDYIFNSMPIDVYFDGVHGELPYRSIKFHTVTLDKQAFMQFPTPTVNFTNNGKFTRITNWVKYPAHGDENAREISVTWEEPCDYKDNQLQRYYPVKDMDGSNREIYKKYEAMVDTAKMQFIGRCGMYVYLDMHMAVSSSMAIAKRFLNE